jgi:hypothetical protein
MSAPLFKVVDSKSKMLVVSNKSFSYAMLLASKHNNDPRNASSYKVLGQ